jgi:lipoate-protein ligase A
MSGWQFIVEGRCPSRANMERDLSLFKTVRSGHAHGFFRLYDWDEPAVTLGHHQKQFSLFDKDLRLPIITRPTGGGAVLHEHDITYSLGVPETGPFCKGITESYIRVSRIFCSALQKCGLDVEMKGEPSRFSPVCFARSAPVELVCSGIKIMGLALLRSGGYLLFQGVIPLQVDTGLAAEVFGPKQAEKSLGILDMMPEFRMDLFTGHLVEAFASEMNVSLPLERNTYDADRHHCYEGKIHPRRNEI